MLNDDGEEYIYAANHIGHFRLTMRLMPLLVAAPSARIVNVASGNLTKACKDPLAIFNDQRRNSKPAFGFNGAGAYKRSKISNVWFTTALAERLDKAGISTVTAHCVNPGKHGDSKILSTAFDNMSTVNRVLVGWLLWWRYKRNPGPVELSALNMIYVCTEDCFESDVRAHYVSSKKNLKTNKVLPFEDKIPKNLANPEFPERLWELSTRVAGVDFFSDN